MKKLLVLVLSAIMVLSLAAVSMAAVTVGGELDLMYKFGLDAPDGGNLQAKSNEGKDAGEVKVKVTADLNDTTQVFTAIKAGNIAADDSADKGNVNNNFACDEAWVSTKPSDIVSLKFGYFGYGFGGKKDLLDLYMRDLKSTVGTLADFTVGEGMTISLFYALDGQQNVGDPTPDAVTGKYGKPLKGNGDGAYALTFAYANDTFGGAISVADYAIKKADATNPNGTVYDLNSGMALNFFYNLAPFTFYFVYDSIEIKDAAPVKSFVNEIIGVNFESADIPVYARFEYDVDDCSWGKDSEANFKDTTQFNKWAVRVGYKFENGLKLQLTRKQTGKVYTADTNELKLIAAF